MAVEKRKKSPVRLAFGIGIVVVGIVILAQGITGLTDNRQRAFAPDGFITIEVVDTPELRTQGLSGREGIAENDGMLFVFDEPSAQNCFWMKDMRFSIDMIWLDSDKTVLNVAPDVSPETFPERFCPEGDAKYGLELASGGAETYGLRPAEELRF